VMFQKRLHRVNKRILIAEPWQMVLAWQFD
jgi:hypothetical protein